MDREKRSTPKDVIPISKKGIFFVFLLIHQFILAHFKICSVVYSFSSLLMSEFVKQLPEWQIWYKCLSNHFLHFILWKPDRSLQRTPLAALLRRGRESEHSKAELKFLCRRGWVQLWEADLRYVYSQYQYAVLQHVVSCVVVSTELLWWIHILCTVQIFCCKPGKGEPQASIYDFRL